MEAQLIVEGMGPWKSFDDLESHLTLDEMMLLHETMAKSKHNNFRMLASLQGVEIPEIEPAEGPDDLPPEVLEMERAWQEKKKAMMPEADKSVEMSSFGLGYSKL